MTSAEWSRKWMVSPTGTTMSGPSLPRPVMAKSHSSAGWMVGCVA